MIVSLPISLPMVVPPLRDDVAGRPSLESIPQFVLSNDDAKLDKVLRMSMSMQSHLHRHLHHDARESERRVCMGVIDGDWPGTQQTKRLDEVVGSWKVGNSRPQEFLERCFQGLR